MIDKIIYLSGSVFPSTAANSVHVMKMCQALAKCAGKVELVARTHSRSLDVPGLYRRGQRAKGVLVIARDHIGAFTAAGLGFPVVFESHGLPSSPYLRWIEKRLFRYPNLLKLVVISDALKRFYRESFDLLPDSIEVHHDAADIPDTQDALDRARRDGAPLRVGYIGHLYKGRGIEIVLAVAELMDQYEFHIYGGLQKDVEAWTNAGLTNTFFHGHIDPVETVAARADSDILIMPYQERLAVAGRNVNTSAWMSPMKLFEYMSAQRPIVSSDLPVLREVLNEDNAILVPPTDVAAWVDALRRLSDASERSRLAERAYADFVKRHTWDRRAENMLENLEIPAD